MQRFDRNSLPSQKGDKLRSQGSNPTGSQKQSFTPGPYSDGVDYMTGATHLNRNIRATQDNHQENIPTGDGCVKKGLIFCEPLS